jgi:hypothetical protein
MMRRKAKCTRLHREGFYLYETLEGQKCSEVAVVVWIQVRRRKLKVKDVMGHFDVMKVVHVLIVIMIM